MAGCAPAPARNTAGNPISRRISAVDGVTQNSNAQDDLRTANRYTPSLLTRCGADLRYQFVSDAYARMLGLRPNQIIGRAIAEILGPAAFEAILPHVRKVLEGHRVEYESEINLKTVGARRIRAIYTPEKDIHGRIKGWIASIIDLSNRFAADRRLTKRPVAKSGWDHKESSDHISTPTVEIFPANVVKRRAIASHGMAVESVQTASHSRIEYCFCAPMHLLVIYEDGARRDGETFVEALPQATLQGFAHKFTFVPAGRRYHEWHELRTPAHLIYFYFHPARLKYHSQTHVNDVLTPRLYFEDEWLRNTTSKLHELIERPTPENQLYFEALGVVIMHELLHLDSGAPAVQSPVHGGLAPWQRRIAANYIEEHLAERTELITLARQVRQSQFHFCRAFKTSFGVPPLQYQAKRRIEHSKLLLTDPDVSVTDIARMIGFSSSSSFVTAFRRATGFTPTGYKRSFG